MGWPDGSFWGIIGQGRSGEEGGFEKGDWQYHPHHSYSNDTDTNIAPQTTNCIYQSRMHELARLGLQEDLVKQMGIACERHGQSKQRVGRCDTDISPPKPSCRTSRNA